MKTFKSNSTQLMENKKWIPSGMLFEINNYGEQIITTPLQLSIQLETKEEADKYFNSYCIKQGYKPSRIN